MPRVRMQRIHASPFPSDAAARSMRGYLGCFCPCVLFGQNVQRLHGRQCFGPCVMHCLLGGCIVLAAYSTLGPAAFWCTPISCYACNYRSELRAKYHLKAEPAGDCPTHFLCHPCALCQEHRELQSRPKPSGLDFYEFPVSAAPPPLTMFSLRSTLAAPQLGASVTLHRESRVLRPPRRLPCLCSTRAAVSAERPYTRRESGLETQTSSQVQNALPRLCAVTVLLAALVVTPLGEVAEAAEGGGRVGGQVFQRSQKAKDRKPDSSRTAKSPPPQSKSIMTAPTLHI
ncbi:unnamed protein product [Closterium sp. NIES-64]|nr:unnamed protein product [Closterium sp. NIES-64]